MGQRSEDDPRCERTEVYNRADAWLQQTVIDGDKTEWSKRLPACVCTAGNKHLKHVVSLETYLPVLRYGWLDVRKSIWPVKDWEMRCWRGYLSWARCGQSETQMICIWSSWYHCHSIISCFIKIQNGLPFQVHSWGKWNYPSRIHRVKWRHIYVGRCPMWWPPSRI